MKNTKLSGAIITLLLFGLIFGVSMVALSLRSDHAGRDMAMFGNGDNRSYDKVYAVQPGGTLKVNADAGSITVTGTDKQEVSIHVTADGSEKMLKRFDISSSLEGTTVTLRGKQENRYFQWFNDNSLNIHYEIQVPKEFGLSLQTAGGDIDIRNIKGRVEGETSGGELVIEQIEGTIRLTTSGGDVRARNLSGTISLETSGGNITGENLIGPLTVETSGGNIDLRACDGKIHASTSGGDVRLVANDNKGIDLSTSGGNVTLRLPKSTGADVSAETTGGDVSCDFPINGKLRDGSLHGKINGGGNTVRLETSGGEILISPLE
jgi:DUF4097 and DUF4098 domain-containing protein YvlB